MPETVKINPLMFQIPVSHSQVCKKFNPLEVEESKVKTLICTTFSNRIQGPVRKGTLLHFTQNNQVFVKKKYLTQIVQVSENSA